MQTRLPSNTKAPRWEAGLLCALLATACSSFAPEGGKENDLGDDTEARDTNALTDTGEDTEPTPSNSVVCYPGELSDDEVCLPLVEHTDSWGADYDYPTPYQGSSQYIAPSHFIDLSTADPSLYLSPNFMLEELMQEWKGRYGLFQVHALESLQAVREITGGALYVNSGYRNVTYNRNVDGATHSRHIFGDAVDMYSAVATLTELGEACEDNAASYVTLYETHVHCDWRDHPLDAAFFDAETSRSGPLPPHGAELVRVGDGQWRALAEGFDEGEPLRRWLAFDSRDQLLETTTSRTYRPPSKAYRIEVNVGGVVVLKEVIEPR